MSRVIVNKTGTILKYVFFISLLFLVTFPLIWMFYSSFKSTWDIFSNPYALPRKTTLANYVKAWAIGNFGRYFFNTIIITVPSVLGLILISALAAYSFARLYLPFKNVIFIYFLIGLMVPPQAKLIPIFQLMSNLHLINNYLALYLTYFSWCATGILILRGFFMDQPIEIEEAARIDGCTEFGIFWKIAFPLAKPAIAAISIFYFVWIWNNFIYPLIFIQDSIKNTIPLGLMAFQGKYQVDWGTLTAALSIAVLPPIIFYLLFQNHFVKGLTAGAIKD